METNKIITELYEKKYGDKNKFINDFNTFINKSQPWLQVLVLIYNSDKPVSLIDLKSLINTKNITKILDKLKINNYIKLDNDSYILTDKGKKKMFLTIYEEFLKNRPVKLNFGLSIVLFMLYLVFFNNFVLHMLFLGLLFVNWIYQIAESNEMIKYKEID